MSKLVTLEPDVRLYLACVLVDALQRAGEALVVPDTLQLQRVTKGEWDQFRLEAAGRNYEAYGIIGSHLEQGAQAAGVERKIDELTAGLAQLSRVV
jgi:hypothetical protein